MGDSHVVFCHQLDVCGVHPDAVGCQHPATEYSMIVEDPGDGPVESFLQDGTLLLGFRKVQVKGGIERPSQLGEFDDGADTEVIGGMGGDSDRRSTCRVVVTGMKFNEICDAVLESSAALGDDDRGHHETCSRLVSSVDHGLLEEVHLAGRRYTALQHLGGPQGHSPPSILRGHATLPRPHGLGEPPLERKAVADPAHERHGRVTVGVHQARHQQTTDVVHRHGCARFWCISLGPDPADPAVLHVDDTGAMDGIGFIARDHDVSDESLSTDWWHGCGSFCQGRHRAGGERVGCHCLWPIRRGRCRRRSGSGRRSSLRRCLCRAPPPAWLRRLK